MAVALEEIKRGVVFRFKTAAHRVVDCNGISDRGFTVAWEYADGKARGGKRGGSQWCHSFRSKAIEVLPDALEDGETIQLLPDRRTVRSLPDPVTISLVTRAPAKWAMVDMQTGELWGHDGQTFVRLTSQQCDAAAHIARTTGTVSKT